MPREVGEGLLHTHPSRHAGILMAGTGQHPPHRVDELIQRFFVSHLAPGEIHQLAHPNNYSPAVYVTRALASAESPQQYALRMCAEEPKFRQTAHGREP